MNCRQAIACNPNFAEAHNNMGNVLRELERFDEAEASYTKAITLKPGFELAQRNLAIVQYAKGDRKAAIKSIELTISINPDIKHKALLAIFEAQSARTATKLGTKNIDHWETKVELPIEPLVTFRKVESELIEKLYTFRTVSFDHFKKIQNHDARYGGGVCSPDFNLFDDDSSIIKSVKDDLTHVMKESFQSNIFIVDSFFNIQGPASGIVRHWHLNQIDRITALDLGRLKYSLVYYLSVGDQNCSQPGILKFYEPNEEIFPSDGMIVIFSCRAISLPCLQW